MNSPIREIQESVQSNAPITSVQEHANLFGTDGIRACVGTFPCTEDDLAKLGHAIGVWATSKYGAQPRLLLGHDTRESAEFMICALSAGLLQSPVAIINVGVLPTPAIIKIATLDASIDGAIIITASHNPFQDNGIKVVDRRAGKLSAQDEQTITNLFYRETVPNNAPRGKIYSLANAEQSYTEALAEYFPTQFLLGKKVVLDCAHGATSTLAPALFSSFGATVITLNNQPDGRNINHHCGATHPETIRDAVVHERADIGFAFDGDGDRVVAVSKNGTIKDGDDILALLLDHPKYVRESTIVATIMSNAGLEEFVVSKNKIIIRTPVGDKHVSAELKNRKLLMGGEQSGHILLADFLNGGDGIFAALRICEVAIQTGNWNLKTFEHVAQIMINVPVEHKRDLQEPSVQTIINAHKAQLNNGTIVVRYSGTENLLRVMIQHKDRVLAEQVGAELVRELKKALK